MGVALVLAATSRGAETWRLRVAAGAHPRADVALSVSLPAGIDLPATVALREPATGLSAPGQVHSHGGRATLRTVLRGTLAAGQERTFDVVAAPAAERVHVQADGDGLTVDCDGRPALRYRTATVEPPAGASALFARNAYVHPVWTPAGRIVTGDFPQDHPHQRGVFLAWTKTAVGDRHPDFWNLGSGTGRVRFLDCDDRFAGPVAGGFTARHAFEDLKAPGGPLAVLEETWEVCFWAPGGENPSGWVWDLTSTQHAVAGVPLALPKYHYGGMAFRGHGDWMGDACAFLSSEGRTRADGNASRGRWGDLSGRSEGAWAGLALLGHPGNPAFPQPFRVHPQVPYFCFVPSQVQA
ncbi:MAG: PmoA family protein, partial [Lentisphaeria bacterium]|nr:PmoA family protein [Lentisphaeria bacterium]